MLTADQVAARLGVKLSTVYAYVSRGILSRTVASDGKSSRFDAAEVDQLARRGRPRTDARRAGTVDVVLATSLTGILDDRLIYRGHDATELARTSTLEAVAELLWTGALPDVGGVADRPGRGAGGPGGRRRACPTSSPLTERLAVVTAALACANPLRIDLQPHAVQAHAASLMTTLVAVLPELAATDRRPRPAPGGGRAGAAAAASTHAGGADVAPPVGAAGHAKRVRVLDAALILLADHELSTSTFAARVAASTRGDPYAVVLSGLGRGQRSAAGRGRPRPVPDAAGGPARWARPTGRWPTRWPPTAACPGMGHPLYETVDPRAACLLELLEPLLGRRDRALIDAVIDVGGDHLAGPAQHRHGHRRAGLRHADVGRRHRGHVRHRPHRRMDRPRHRGVRRGAAAVPGPCALHRTTSGLT